MSTVVCRLIRGSLVDKQGRKNAKHTSVTLCEPSRFIAENIAELIGLWEEHSSCNVSRHVIINGNRLQLVTLVISHTSNCVSILCADGFWHFARDNFFLKHILQ